MQVSKTGDIAQLAPSFASIYEYAIARMALPRYRLISIVSIIVLALLLRIPSITYGLPLHLFADEEVNVYSALEMIRSHTVIPLLHPSEFRMLYEPPVLAYLYTAAFIPALGVLYILHHTPPLQEFMHSLIIDPSIFWVIGRSLNVLLSIGSILLLYHIGKILFKEELPAILAALLFATSFTDVTLAATTRIWEAGTFFSILSFLFLITYFRPPYHTRWPLILSGCTLGVSFGTNYMVYFLPFLMIYLAYLFYEEGPSIPRRRMFLAISTFTITFVITGALFILVAPHPLQSQLASHVSDTSRSMSSLFAFLLGALWNYETPLLIFAAIGLISLWAKKTQLAVVYTIYLIALPIGMYILSFCNLGHLRYIHPLIALLTIPAGYGLSVMLRYAYPKKLFLLFFMPMALASAVCIYTLAVYVPYSMFLYKGDTRVQAIQWVNTTIPPGSTLLVNSDPVRFSTTLLAVQLVDRTAGQSALRAVDKMQLQSHQSAPEAYNSINTYLIGTSTQKAVIDRALKELPEPQYVVTDSWSDSSNLQDILDHATLQKSFPSRASDDEQVTSSLIGGDAPVTNKHLLQKLWSMQSFGPDVTIYQLTKRHDLSSTDSHP